MNETLKELFIGDNKLMSTDGVQVGNLLKFNHKLELLDLRNNHLQVSCGINSLTRKTPKKQTTKLCQQNLEKLSIYTVLS